MDIYSRRTTDKKNMLEIIRAKIETKFPGSTRIETETMRIGLVEWLKTDNEKAAAYGDYLSDIISDSEPRNEREYQQLVKRIIAL
jgi:hypothetical protein